MDDFEYKLQQNNPVSIVQAITKLLTIIKEKKLSEQSAKSKNINENDTKELQMLKSKCGDGNPMISTTASQGIIQLVEEGVLPVSTTLSDLILNLSTAKCYGGITMAIGNLLLIDMRRTIDVDKSYTCPFSLQKNQHPFIKVLMDNQNIWLEIYTQMQMFVDHFDDKISSNSLELLRPVFFYILCKPTNKLCETSRQHVWKLLTSINTISGHQIAFEIISSIQLGHKEDILDACDYLQQLSELSKDDTQMCGAVILYLSSLLVKILENGNNLVPYIKTIFNIIDQYGCENTHSIILIMLAECIEICPPIYLKEILKLCCKILSKNSYNTLSIGCVTASLLHWLIYPSILLNESLRYAKEILDHFETPSTQNSFTTNTIFRNKYFKNIIIANSKIDTFTKICILAEKWQSDQKSLIEWLNKILESNNTEVIKIFGVVSSIFISENDNLIRQKSLLVLEKIVESNRDLASKVLVLLFFKLSNETEPKMQVELLKMLPKMAVLKENVPLILTILETLKKETGALKSLCLTLYFDLFKIEVRTFPYLENMLTDTNPGGEFSVVKAQTLKEICKTKPELHGKEMVAHLAQILNKHGDQRGSLPSSLAIDALTALCDSEIIDIVNTWSSLSPKFSKEKRVYVINSLCHFFGNFSEVRTISKEHEKLKFDAISKLWYYTSYSDNVETVINALSALEKFNIDDIALKQLPDIYRQNMTLPKAYAKTPDEAVRKPEDVLPYIPGECWVQLLQNINHDALESAEKLLQTWIAHEISEYRSGVYIVPDGKTEPENYNSLPHKSIVRGLGNAVRLTATGDIKIPLTNATLCSALRILGQVYSKPLPPLNWCFLHDLLHKNDEVKRLCINLACKQMLISGSALRLIENYIEAFQPTIENFKEIEVIFSNLGNLCQVIAPNMLRPVVTKSLQLAFEMAAKDRSEELFTQLSNDLKNAFLNQKIHEANRTLLGQIVELSVEQMDGTSKLYETFTDCIIEAPTKFIERITSPSLWWETTKDKFERALVLKCKIAIRSEKNPFEGLNELINQASKIKSIQTYLLSTIIDVFQKHSSSNFTDMGQWLLEILGQIQEALTKEIIEIDQIVYLCDLFLLAVIVLAGHEIYTCPVNQIVVSKEVRLNLFPVALMDLIKHKCYNIISQVLEWLYHMSLCKDIPLNYQQTFYRSLFLMRHEKAFIESSKWMKYMSIKYPMS